MESYGLWILDIMRVSLLDDEGEHSFNDTKKALNQILYSARPLTGGSVPFAFALQYGYDLAEKYLSYPHLRVY
jgi:hypothetical protein